MPFRETTKEHTEEYWMKHFEDFLKPLIEEDLELKVKRSEPLRGDITRQIITDLVTSSITIADLTDHNPNVFWELGVRQSFKHGTITIAEIGTEIPFDIGAKGTLFYYPTDHVKNAEFCRQLKNAIKDCLENPDVPDSHVLETLSGRGTLFEILNKESMIRKIKALLRECAWNDAIIIQTEEFVKRNQNLRKNKNEKELKYITGRCLTSSIELLNTNRYIDADDTFYENIISYFRDLFTINEQLSMWTQMGNATEMWFLNNLGKPRKYLEDVRKQLMTICSELQKSLDYE